MQRTPPQGMIGHRVAPAQRSEAGVRAICLGLALLLVSCVGCSRPFWRTQADFDSYNLLFEKTNDDRWNVPRLTLEPDPRSRIYDPFDPDVEPLPPDDATANQYMHWVDGMRGYKSWHQFGQQLTVENPQWMSQFEFLPEEYQVDWIDPSEPEGEKSPGRPVATINNLTLEQAIELANLNSREYQLQLENTYQTALALTFARFQFNVRYLGLNGQPPQTSLDYVNQPSTLDTLELNKRFGVSQLLPTGGQWVAEIANNTLWLFSSGGQSNSASVLSYSLVQPLLAGGGRKVVLENLTLGERQVLYDIRTLARFRKQFFANVVGSPGGYLGLMQQVQQVDNLRSNLREFRIQIEKQREIINNPRKVSQEKLNAWPENLVLPADLAERLVYDEKEQQLEWRGELTVDDEARLLALSDDPGFQRAIRAIGGTYRIQVFTQELSQLLTQAATTQINLRSAEANLLDAIDSYKLQLGLPTDFQITLDRTLLKPFQLIDHRLNRVEERLLTSIQSWVNPDGTDLSQEQLTGVIRQMQRLWKEVNQEGLQLVALDLKGEEANRPERLKRLPTEEARQQMLRNVERDQILLQRAQDAHEYLRLVLDELQLLLRGHALPETEPEEPQLLNPQEFPNLREYLRQDDLELPTLGSFLGVLRMVREDFLQIVQGLKVVQVGSRSELITLRDFDISLDDAIALAIENRLDLMNARGQVMDARRNLEVAANRMEGVLNVVTRGDIRNSGGNKPFDFRADESTFQFGLQFTAPLDQVLVRNDYRNALIEYQQSRRAYMLLEDQVKQFVRAEWRQLQLQRANFETSRQNIRYAAIQYDVVVENTYQPSGSAASTLPTVGAASRQNQQNQGLALLQALNGILNAQNTLIGNWVTYERNRINIYRDMDIMQIDERGLWLDSAYQPGLETLPPTLSEPADVIPLPPEVRLDRTDSPRVTTRIADPATVATAEFETPDDSDGSDGTGRAGLPRVSVRPSRAAVAGHRVLRTVGR